MYEKLEQDSEYSCFCSCKSQIFSLKQHLYQKYGLIDIESLLAGKDFYFNSIPTSYFCSELSILETIVKFLKEERKLTFKEISQLTKRGVTTISTTYKKSLQKKQAFGSSKIKIPISVIAYRKLSTFEAIVLFLKVFHNLRFCEISKILCRDSRVIWRTHDNATKKVSKKDFIVEINSIIKNEEPGISRKDIIRVFNVINNCSITNNEFIKLFNEIPVSNRIWIPAGAFLGRPLSGVIGYLKDELSIPSQKISKMLKRSPSLIVTSYKPQEFDDFSFSIPLKLLSNRNFSVMEIVVHYLIKSGLTNRQTADLLKRKTAVIITHKKRYISKNA